MRRSDVRTGRCGASIGGEPAGDGGAGAGVCAHEARREKSRDSQRAAAGAGFPGERPKVVNYLMSADIVFDHVPARE
jgi:hypothetical protein